MLARQLGMSVICYRPSRYGKRLPLLSRRAAAVLLSRRTPSGASRRSAKSAGNRSKSFGGVQYRNWLGSCYLAAQSPLDLKQPPRFRTDIEFRFRRSSDQGLSTRIAPVLFYRGVATFLERPAWVR